jgi:ABC-type multidrug transport system fused ATPase/permease subunit
VTFGYEPEHPVLREIELTANAGEITALVGPTGSGKSTLVSLLLRLFDPDHGRIEVDGQDLRGYTLDSLRASVAIALQENLLFGTTVRENIRYAAPDASEDQVRKAARIACAEAFIDALPHGFDTALGERGSKLSTGQRQRLSIARAVIKDTPVLILDEPTASLDAETEVQVLKNLAQWGSGRAIFLITHRLSTIRRADKIIYLHEGEIVETGSHAELMSRADGAYRRFVELEREATPQATRRAAGASA